MKKFLALLVVLVAVTSSAFAEGMAQPGSMGQVVGVNAQGYAGASSDNNPTFNFGKPAPVVPIGPPVHSSSSELFTPQVPAYALSHAIQQAVAQFGPVLVRGSSVEAQYVNKENADTIAITFAPSAMVSRVGPPLGNPDDWGMAFFPIPTEGNMSLLNGERVVFVGVTHVQSLPGVALIHPAEQRYVRNELVQYLGYMDGVMAIPIPKGYAVSVGVSNESSGKGVSVVLTRLVTAFAGISPSYSQQEGNTFATGTWGMPFLLLKRDPNGVPFNAAVVNVPTQNGMPQAVPAPAPAAAMKAPDEKAIRQQALNEARQRIEARRKGQ
jgi:hypothetical protein